MSGWIQIGEDRWILDVTYVVSPGLLGIAEIRQDENGAYRVLGDVPVSCVSQLRDDNLRHAKLVAEGFALEKIRAAANVAERVCRGGRNRPRRKV